MAKRSRDNQDPRFVYDNAGNQTGLNWDHYRPKVDDDDQADKPAKG